MKRLLLNPKFKNFKKSNLVLFKITFNYLIYDISALNRNYVRKKFPMHLENLYKYCASV